MKILKRIVIGVLAIVALALITALFVDKDLAAERSVVINRPASDVYNYVKLLRNQDEFSKWSKMDPAMKKSYTGTDGTVGFTYAWQSEKDDVGTGEQTITKLVDGERVDHRLHFIKPFESTASSYMTTQATGSGATKVTWGFTGKMDYPFNLMGLFTDMNKSIGDDFEVGLTNLKNRMESTTAIDK